MPASMWMVRSASGGSLADEFVEKGLIAIGWNEIGDLSQFTSKAKIIAAVAAAWPDWPQGKVMGSASQLLRFRDELAIGDRVLTYDSGRRIYHLGSIASIYQHSVDQISGYANVRKVEWKAEIDRDKLSVDSRNSLGSILTLFRVPDLVAKEIDAIAVGQQAKAALVKVEEIKEDEEDLLERYRAEAFEITKDRVNRLKWDQMQELVAGLLRAMGYKTRIAPAGPDRGVDVLASPDGFGFESPRIVVQVKHRANTTGAEEIRSFLGGRHRDDKGLYVSTGGFTKDARYEAERANIPVMLLDIDDLVKAIFRNYESMDLESQKLLPLRKIYWPG